MDSKGEKEICIDELDPETHLLERKFLLSHSLTPEQASISLGYGQDLSNLFFRSAITGDVQMEVNP